jgi:hypothetical protein
MGEIKNTLRKKIINTMKFVITALFTMLMSVSSAQNVSINFYTDMSGQTIAPEGVFISGEFNHTWNLNNQYISLNPNLSNWAPIPMNDMGNGIWEVRIELPFAIDQNGFPTYELDHLNGMRYTFLNGSVTENLQMGSACSVTDLNSNVHRLFSSAFSISGFYSPTYFDGEYRIFACWETCEICSRWSYGVIGNQTMRDCDGDYYLFFPFVIEPSVSGNKQWYYKLGIVDAPESQSTSGWTEAPSGVFVTDDGGITLVYLQPTEESITYGCFIATETGGQWSVGAIYQIKNYFSPSEIFGESNISPSNVYSYGVSTNPEVTSYDWSATNGNILSGQGTNLVSVAWGQNGPYELSLNEYNSSWSGHGVSLNWGYGCQTSSHFTAVNNDCAISVSVASSSGISICQGDSVLLTSATNESNVTYQWYKNGQEIPGATYANYFAPATGNYQVRITQNGCSAISLIMAITEFPSVIVPSVSLEQANQGCLGGEATLTMIDTDYNTIIWNNGVSNATSINVSQSGSYFVTVTDNTGCSTSSIPIDVNFSILDPVPVCIVTVDQVTGKNNVVWEPITSDLINSYVILKETNVANEYAQIGTVAYGSNGLFEDVNSNPQVQANRYKLALIDTCGILSSGSSFHKTIHLAINQGLGNNVNLIWSDYEGFDFGSYSIYRGTSPNTLNLLSTIASNLNSYTDVNPPAGETYYMIEVVGVSCDPSRTLVYSHSNILDTTVGVEDYVSTAISLYPNPAKTSITLQVNATLTGQEYIVFDAVGKVIYKNKIQSTNEIIQLENFNNGSYFVKVNEVVKRFVVQH